MAAEPQAERVPVTQMDVARHAQVSRAVVSYVLNDGPRPVAAETRERVQRSMDALGYRPNAVARALRMRKTMTIGLVVPDNSNPYFAELAKAIEDAAYTRGYAVILGNSSNDERRETAQLRTLIDRQVDGLLLISSSLHPDLSLARSEALPLVLLDRAGNDFACPSVVVDNRGGSRAGVEHLIEHGHQRIACVAGPDGLPGGSDRENGWREALKSCGLVSRGMLHRTPFTRQGGYDATRALLARPRRPSAIFACSDLQGIGALRACHEAGLQVPEDIALLAFDGTQESEFTTPPMAVVRQPAKAIADRGLRLLLEGGTTALVEHVVLPPELVLRQSCGCDDR